MTEKEESLKGLRAGGIIGEYKPLILVKEGPEHDEAVQHFILNEVLKWFFDAEHVFAKAPARTFVMNTVRGQRELIAPGKEPYSRTLFLIKIGVSRIHSPHKNKKIHRTDTAVEHKILDHIRILPHTDRISELFPWAERRSGTYVLREEFPTMRRRNYRTTGGKIW
jgi:hypothetical protein